MSQILFVTQLPIQDPTLPPLLFLVFHSWNADSFEAKTSVRTCQKNALRGSAGDNVVLMNAETSGP